MSEEPTSKREAWADALLDKFVDEILVEIASHKLDAPDQALSVAKRLGARLDKFVASLEEEGQAEGREGLNGTSVSDHSSAELRTISASSKRKEPIGRNFVSRLRELVVLEYLNDETRPIALHEVQGVVAQKGFQDSESAVISQLHRLHQNAFIEKPDNMNGVYLITQEGRHHLARLRETHGMKLEEWLSGASH